MHARHARLSRAKVYSTTNSTGSGVFSPKRIHPVRARTRHTQVAGNVRKLQLRAATMPHHLDLCALALHEYRRNPALTSQPDSFARALYWTNRIMMQISRSFENLLDHPKALRPCRPLLHTRARVSEEEDQKTEAYLRESPRVSLEGSDSRATL